jgi:uncharacterized protein (DUF1330 family)
MKFYAMASYVVDDFNRFMAEFEGAQDMLQKWGFIKTYLNRDVANPNRLIIIHQCEDLQKARDFYKSKEFQQCLAEAGVPAPQVTLMEELARTPQAAAA